MNELVAMTVPKGVQVTATGVIFTEKKLTDAQLGKLWAEGVSKYNGLAARVASSYAWFLGDVANYTSIKFSHGRLEELVAETGLSPAHIRDCARVASSFDHDARSTSLSWTHHRVLAAVNPDERAALMAEAERDDMTVAAIRERAEALRAVRPGRVADQSAAVEPDEVEAPRGITTQTVERIVSKLEARAEVDDQVDEIISTAKLVDATVLKPLISALKEDARVRQHQVEALEKVLAKKKAK